MQSEIVARHPPTASCAFDEVPEVVVVVAVPVDGQRRRTLVDVGDHLVERAVAHHDQQRSEYLIGGDTHTAVHVRHQSRGGDFFAGRPVRQRFSGWSDRDDVRSLLPGVLKQTQHPFVVRVVD